LASNWYNKCLEFYPGFDLVYFKIGVLFENKKQYQKAINWYSAAIKKN